jgi:gamma-glutamylaminecyclotransferase
MNKPPKGYRITVNPEKIAGGGTMLCGRVWHNGQRIASTQTVHEFKQDAYNAGVELAQQIAKLELPTTGKVAVYGTLKRGFHNAHFLAGVKFLGTAKTFEKYPMLDKGIPYLFNVPGNGFNIVCEIYEIVDSEMMHNLDRLEGHPRHYTRTPVNVILNGQKIEVFIYFANFDFTEDTFDSCIENYARKH